jgi:MtrB/PioB family decaheme-associated outer membrane protein
LRPGAIVRSGASLVLIALAPFSAVLAAADEAVEATPPDMSEWKCKYCAFEEGWHGDMNLGIGYVSDDSAKFGEYNGLNEKGAYAIVDANLYYRSEDARYLDLSVSDLGIDSRSLSIAGGRQGSYDLFLSYDEIPHYISDSASTPYRGNGGDLLTLPSSWVRAGSTAGMTALDSSLQPVDIETMRKRLATGIKVTTESPWKYKVEVRRDDKQGNKYGGGSFFFNSTQLVEPVDYITDEIDAAVSYSARKWQAKFAYYGSTFSNANESLTWDNAYTPLAAGADQGQLALPPDNEFHQLTLSLAYDISDRNHVSADVAVGRMEQNADFVQATLNPTLALPPLPANSADAEVDTTNTRIKLVSMVTDQLRLSAGYSHDDRDNKTPQLVYDWVTTDTFIGAQRSNQPYSVTRDSLSLQADYSYARGIKLGLGFKRDDTERDLQEVDNTREDTVSTSIRVRNIENLFLEFKLAVSARDGSTYEELTAVDPPQNPLMRKYNLADRNRDNIGLYANLTPSSYYSIGFSIDGYSDSYDKSVVGLTSSRSTSLNIDVSGMLSESTGVTVFLGTEKIQSEQAGSSAFADPDWIANNEDSFDNFGIGVTHVLIENSLDIGADYTLANSRGKITVNGSATAEPFPDFTTRLDSIRLYANYHVDENMSFRLAYWHETYDISDWASDGVDANTVSNLLGFGAGDGSYSNDVIKVSLGYTFF